MTYASGPLWMVAELTYACPLQCVYCSNPVNFAQSAGQELTTEQWLDVLLQARQLGVVQVGFTGGEPLIRKDLESIIKKSRDLGFYSNLITSALGLTEGRLQKLVKAGLDHVQISFEAGTRKLHDELSVVSCFEHKIAMAKAVKKEGISLVLNFVIHRENIHEINDMLTLAISLGADSVELANCQYYGWANLNREYLLPSSAQLQKAEADVHAFRQSHKELEIYYVVPDYYEGRPKACSAGWGNIAMVVSPEGNVLPCHGAHHIEKFIKPNIRSHTLEWIYRESDIFNVFRGDKWMKSPCADCEERHLDFGGCRCQAYILTGDAANCDPVCTKSPDHRIVEKIIEKLGSTADNLVHNKQPYLRNKKNSKRLQSGRL